MKFLSFIFFFILIFAFANVKSGEVHAADWSIADCTVTQDNACDYIYVSFTHNNSGTRWEVRYKIVYSTAGSTFEWPNGATKSVVVPAGTTNLPAITSRRGYSPYAVHWATTCVDPITNIVGFRHYNDNIYTYSQTVNIDPRDNRSNDGLGPGNDLGFVSWTGSSTGYGAGSTAQCYPCRCGDWNDRSCGGGSCGNNRMWQTRNCNPNGCGDESRCVERNACECNCGNWNRGSCGGGSCGPNKRQYTRNCTGNSCGAGAESECRDDISCTEGPIGGTVYIDGKGSGREDNKFDSGEGYQDTTVQRGQIQSGSFNSVDSRNSDPNYSFGGLTGGTSHDIRVQPGTWNSNRLNLETDNPRRDIRVPNSNVDFRFSFKKFRVFGTVYWDPNGIPGDADDRPYVNQGSTPGKVVRVCVVGQGCDESDSGGTNAGDYNITGIPTNLDANGARYTVRVSDFRPAHTVTNNSQVINITTANRRVDFYISPDGPPTYNIGGIVYLDDGDGALDPGTGTNRDQPYRRSRVTIDLNPSDRNGQTDRGNGRYTIPDNPAGTYTASITGGLGANYAPVTGFESRSVTVGPSRTNVNFLVQQVTDPPGVISGGIFIDGDGDGVRDCVDEDTNCAEPYMAPTWTGQRVTLSPGTVNKNGPDSTDGFYSFTNLTGTSYSVNLSRTGTGYVRSHPTTTDTYTITNLGNPSTCTVSPASANATCTATGDVVNADFGLSTSLAATSWIQSIGGNMRSDQGFDVTIPSGQYMSITQGSLASPGIVFNFDVSGNFSAENWHVDDEGYLGKVVRTSYSSITSALLNANQEIIPFFGDADSPCTGSSPNCAIGANSEQGYYRSDTGVNITAAANSFVAGRDYIFLVNGNLTINSNIEVPRGATVMFIASGNITIAGAVTNIEGIYSANQDFIVNVSPTNQQLVIEGSVIGNAAKNAANNTPFINNRTMGAANNTTPSVRFIYRPDFVLNAPNLIKSSNYKFSEVAPGPLPVGGVIPTNIPAPTAVPTATPNPTPTPTTAPTPTPEPTVLAYNESGGNVMISASSARAAVRTSRSGFSWVTRNTPITGTGTVAGGSSLNNSFIQARPVDGSITGSFSVTSPEVEYNICFNQTGNYRVLFRGSGPANNSNNIAIGLDGAGFSGSGSIPLYIQGSQGSDWRWTARNNSNDIVLVNITTTGLHKFSLWMREAGARVDRIYFTKNGAPAFVDTANSGGAISGTVQCPL